MSLRLKLTLIITAIVGAALFTTWFFTGRNVLQPFTREVMAIYLDEAVYVADQVHSGASPQKLGAMLNLEIRTSKETPAWVSKIERGEIRAPRCQHETRGDYAIMYCRGRRAPVALGNDRGWVIVRRDLDIAKPSKRVAEILLSVALGVLILSAGVAVLVTRPLATTTRAMERIAAGDLAHRLPVAGGRELEEAARIFNSMADRVDALLRTERELMAGISHELRTPLARLRLETELLRDAPVPEQRLEAMDADLQEIDALIGELLECSRLSLGDRTLVRTRVDLAEVVDEAIERYPLPNHQVVVTGLPERVMGDHARLVRVVGNLLQNAGKYAPPSTEVRIDIRETEIEVTDSGPGLAPEDLARIFEPFYRGEQARSHSKQGLGLGLMLARQVITLHGGVIEAKNRPEGGLSIRFWLPPAA